MATATRAKTKQKPITFISRYLDMRYVVVPKDRERNHQGRTIRTLPGKAIEFEGREFTTEDPEEIKFLHDHPDWGVHLWQKDLPAPGAVRPTIEEQQDAIMAALAKGDADGIQKVVEAERATHKRESVFRTARGALSHLAGDTDDGAEPA